MERIDFYVIGPVTGRAELNRPAFEEARRRIEAACPGATVRIPHDVIAPDTPWGEAMRISVASMCGAGCVVRLPDWGGSRGARVESDLAEQIGIPLATLGEVAA